MKIGIDLDNTLICYDEAFQRVGKDEGLLPVGFEGDKAAVKRALLKESPDGLLWETLQGLVYGRRIDAATLFDGVARFLETCRERDAEVAIVSHKTELAHHDPLRTDLRAAALQWMNGNRFFDPAGLGLQRHNVYFERTRDEKIARIARLGSDVFVDDLAEVLDHENMPAACRKILFGQERQERFEQYATWHELCDAVFPRR
ncbi:MAG: hypothetical protein JOY64_11075 [Alphaproteobacteria bacterium]|nr:hypothetical protein [Alphaproteobacteria bacterium]MBV8408164.1 hypothetical protein [Alphaproteobacteria bacterium]